MKKVIQRLACFLGIAAILCAGISACMEDDNVDGNAWGAQNAAYAEEPTDVRPGELMILYTNNTDITADGLDWIQKAGNLKRYYEEQGVTVYLLDAGNVFFNSGTEETPALPDLQAKSVEYVTGLLNEAGYDGVLPGSRDLVNGAGYLQEKLRQSRIPRQFVVLCSNIQCRLCENSVFSESGIIEEDNILTGFMGMTDMGEKEEIIDVEDPQKAAKDNIRDFRNYAGRQEKTLEEVIAVLHLGRMGDAGNAVNDFTEKVSGVNVIIDGNCEQQYDEQGENAEGETYIVTGIGAQPECVGYVKIQTEEGKTMEAGIIDEEHYEDLMEKAAG